MICRLAKRGFKPAKYFSIDRVFRNEAIDRTHLAEFHQIEGACLSHVRPRCRLSELCQDASACIIWCKASYQQQDICHACS